MAFIELEDAARKVVKAATKEVLGDQDYNHAEVCIIHQWH